LLRVIDIANSGPGSNWRLKDKPRRATRQYSIVAHYAALFILSDNQEYVKDIRERHTRLHLFPETALQSPYRSESPQRRHHGEESCRVDYFDKEQRAAFTSRYGQALRNREQG
jgi:hypothetical protein